MGLFAKKDPIEKWRRQWTLAAAFADHTGWEIDPDAGVHTMIDGQLVNVLIPPTHSVSGMSSVHVIVEAGRQAERSHANQVGDDGGEAIDFEGWQGQAAPGSGLLEGGGSAPLDEVWDKVVRAAGFLVARIS